MKKQQNKILSTLLESMLEQVIGYKASKLLWDEIHNMFKWANIIPMRLAYASFDINT